jgi:hypothetical protein
MLPPSSGSKNKPGKQEGELDSARFLLGSLFYPEGKGLCPSEAVGVLFKFQKAPYSYVTLNRKSYHLG